MKNIICKISAIVGIVFVFSVFFSSSVVLAQQTPNSIQSDAAGGAMTDPSVRSDGTINPNFNANPGASASTITTSGSQVGPGDGSYQLLVPLPGFGTTVQTTDFAKFLNQVIKLSITLAIVIAAVEISIGGLKYMTTDSMNSKSEGKGQIIGAILGLVVLAASYLILNTINPALLNLELNVPSTGTVQPANTTSQSTTIWDRAQDSNNVSSVVVNRSTNTSSGSEVVETARDNTARTETTAGRTRTFQIVIRDSSGVVVETRDFTGSSAINCAAEASSVQRTAGGGRTATCSPIN